MPEGCPGNSGGGHYWIIDGRTGEAVCKFCPRRQKYDIDAMIYPDYKGRPQDYSETNDVRALRATLQFTVDAEIVDALKGLRSSLQEQLNTVSHQVQAYKEVCHKTTSREVKDKAGGVVKNMESSASIISRQLKAVSFIVKGHED
jgi:hypothetical protein